MDTSVIEALPWCADLSLNSANIWTVQQGRCAIGVVLLVESSASVALIRKARVKGYEFSDRLALPGGLVRGVCGPAFAPCFEQSIRARAEEEAGLTAEQLSELVIVAPEFAPVSRYTVKCVERFTAVFTVRANIKRPQPLVSADKSIQEAFFSPLPPKWEVLAPANRLILARAMRDHADDNVKTAARASVNEALAFCNDAAAIVNVPPVPDPWMSPEV